MVLENVFQSMMTAVLGTAMELALTVTPDMFFQEVNVLKVTLFVTTLTLMELVLHATLDTF
jgi:hypothetical protein